MSVLIFFARRVQIVWYGLPYLELYVSWTWLVLNNFVSQRAWCNDGKCANTMCINSAWHHQLSVTQIKQQLCKVCDVFFSVVKLSLYCGNAVMTSSSVDTVCYPRCERFESGLWKFAVLNHFKQLQRLQDFMKVITGISLTKHFYSFC